jgi:UDP-3-O-[3-hydroxymyristoyl] glucosamine N-acyltransferase
MPESAIAASATVASDARIGPFCVIGEDAVIGAGAELGAHVVVHPGTQVGDRVVVQDGAVLGKPPRLAPGSASEGEAPPLVVGAGTSVCAHAILFAGARLGESVIVGDQAVVRERARLGDRVLVGRGATIENDVSVGDRVKLQAHVYLTAFSVVEDDVFVGPCAMTTNDDTMARRDPSGGALQGATLRRACRVGGGAVLTPGIEVGAEAFVAAGAVVTADVPERSVVMGVPARVVRRVPDEDVLERWR